VTVVTNIRLKLRMGSPAMKIVGLRVVVVCPKILRRAKKLPVLRGNRGAAVVNSVA
jgi:hypothetical protein